MSNITVRESPKDDDDDTRDDVRTIPGLIDLFKTNNDFCSSFFSTVGAGYGMRGQTDDDSGVVQSQSSDDGSASSQPSMAAPFGLRGTSNRGVTLAMFVFFLNRDGVETGQVQSIWISCFLYCSTTRLSYEI